MNEATLERKARAYALTLGYLCYKFTSPGNFGVPDRIFINKVGVTIYIEFKAPGKIGRLSKHQAAQIEKLQRNQAPVYVVDNLDACKAVLDEWEWKDRW